MLMCLSFVIFLFFFSSRRRHTRCLSDWSSDVCSSDLPSSTSISGTRGTLLTKAKPCRKRQFTARCEVPPHDVVSFCATHRVSIPRLSPSWGGTSHLAVNWRLRQGFALVSRVSRVPDMDVLEGIGRRLSWSVKAR